MNKYEKPSLRVYGSAQELTRMFGGADVSDMVRGPGGEEPGEGGSTDGVIVPDNP